MALTHHQKHHLDGLLKDFQETIALDITKKRELSILKKYAEEDWDVLLAKAEKFVQWHIDKKKWPAGADPDDPATVHDLVEKYTDWSTLDG